MSSVIISGDTSGAITIAAPAVAGTTTLTLPATTGTVLNDATVGVCRAWVNFNGTTNVGGFCTIRASFNVSSITDNGTGDYTVNFTTAMPDTNYCFFGSSGQTAAASAPAMLGINRDNFVYSTTAIRLYNLTGAGALPDSAYLNVSIFR